MRYLKLYEAFNSNILSKTLKYLNKESKNEFLEKLKSICDNIDFPLSELSDDQFHYLGFNEAIKKDGIKFWIDIEGNLLSVQDSEFQEFDTNEFRNILDQKKDHLKTGDDIQISTNLVYVEWVNGKLVINENTYYILSKYSSLSGGPYDEILNKLPEFKDEYKYCFAFYNRKNYGETGSITSKNTISKYRIKTKANGDFAIIFNPDVISPLSIKKSDIQKTRIQQKTGAIKLKTNDEIFNDNLKMRFRKIAVLNDLDTFYKMFRRILNDKYILFVGFHYSKKYLENLINYWECKNDKSKINANHLNEWLDSPGGAKIRGDYRSGEISYKDLLELYTENQEDVLVNMIEKSYKWKLDINSRPVTPEQNLIKNKLINLGQLIIDKISNGIGDETDIFLAKMRLDNIHIIFHKYFIYNLDEIAGYAKGLLDLNDAYGNIEKLKGELDKIEVIIKRL